MFSFVVLFLLRYYNFSSYIFLLCSLYVVLFFFLFMLNTAYEMRISDWSSDVCSSDLAARIHYRSDGDFAVPMVVRTPWGGGVHGALYHSQAIEAFYAHVPGLKVVAPSTPADVCGMLRAAVDDPDPVLFLEHKRTYRLISGLVPDDTSWQVPIGLADVARTGDDPTVVTYGLHRHPCIAAAEHLASETGALSEVIDLRTISPLYRAPDLASAIGNAACRER